jgi:vacuolar-type H+-ATPase subunit H
MTPEQHIEVLKHERDDAIREANRRDKKWMDGINELLGEELDYGDPSARNCASKALYEWSRRERKRAEAAEAKCAALEKERNEALKRLADIYDWVPSDLKSQIENPSHGGGMISPHP